MIMINIHSNWKSDFTRVALELADDVISLGTLFKETEIFSYFTLMFIIISELIQKCSEHGDSRLNTTGGGLAESAL